MKTLVLAKLQARAEKGVEKIETTIESLSNIRFYMQLMAMKMRNRE